MLILQSLSSSKRRNDGEGRLTTIPDRLHIDFETHSQRDLRRCGAWAYAEDPSTEVTMMGWAFNDDKPRIWAPGQPFPENVHYHLRNEGEVHAWNANFELAIWNLVLRRQERATLVPPLAAENIHCTMAAAAYWGLPLALEQATQALRLPEQKDKIGHGIMLRMARPRHFTGNGQPVWWHDQDAARYDALARYCIRDVEVERLAFHAIPPLPVREREIWLVDHRMNHKGIKVDLTLVDALDHLTREETRRLDEEMRTVTGGASSTRTVGALTRWLTSKGVKVDSLDKNHMGALLETPRLDADANSALLIRQEAAKTSTAKLRTMKGAASKDGRVRGAMQYYGAVRTGRWAGRLVQIQNYPRIPKGFPVRGALKSVLDEQDDPDTLKFKYGSVLGTISTLLRPCFVADTGKALVSVDFSQVEARVVAWLASQEDILEVFQRNEDVYTYAADKIGSSSRQLGKIVTLALGFGMGTDKFVETAWAPPYYIDLDPAEARQIVSDWRTANRHIVSLWYECEDAVRAVIGGDLQHRWHTVDKLGFRMAKGNGLMAGAMLMRLPSGRHLVYRDARIEDGSITYSGINQYTRAWTDIRTYGGKLVENAVQATARDLMADLMVEIDRLWPDTLVASIHDEAVMEVEATRAKLVLSEVLQKLRQGPEWAAGLPLEGEGYVGSRYGKV
jgi:DNA polymerase